MLGLVQSLKNTLAPINRIPPEVLSLIPDHLDEGEYDKSLITVTHVCHGWRDAFTSRSSLWTRLHFTNVDKTRTYIQRSRTSPLNIFLHKAKGASYLDDAFSLVIPHIRRIKLLIVYAETLPSILTHFHCHIPLLEGLAIVKVDTENAGTDDVLDGAFCGGDLSSLHKLHMYGVTTQLPWKNLANLRLFKLTCRHPEHNVTRLLDFFESAPLLHTVQLRGSIPGSSDAPANRTVSLPHLNSLYIAANAPHAITFVFQPGHP